MFTPQQIDQVSFGTATFGGYNKEDVDAFLEPLTEDYITLYKENALLKSKMRVLVTKLEEYRKNEASMKDAIVNAQKTCDMMVKEAEAKCTQMLNEASNTAAQNVRNADALIAAENERVDEAKRVATARIEQIQAEIRTCIQALDRIKEANVPKNPRSAFDYDRVEAHTTRIEDTTDAVAKEIAQNLEALVGTTEETAPKAEPKHPTRETTTSQINVIITDEKGETVTDDKGEAVTSISIVTEAPGAANTNQGGNVNGSSSTGDVAFVVVAVMVATLGCALVVRKVSAR